MKNKIDNLQNEIVNNPELRKELARQNHYWFFHIYFSHYVKYETAQFQKEIFELTEDESIKQAVIVAFRGSAKSTIMSLSYPIWAMLGKLEKKFITIASLTQSQARLILFNIKEELEKNKLLVQDFGPFVTSDDEWRWNSLVVSKFQTRIMAFSANESIRGYRHSSNRPDLIICDDIEDLNSVKTQEGRDKTFRWLTGDLIPMGSQDTKVVVIGNLLHEDSIIMRLKNRIGDKYQNSVFKSYPLINETGDVLWSAKYPTQETLESGRVKIGDIAWKREYLLTIVPDNDVVVRHDWIQYYDELPSLINNGFRFVITSVDLAISEKSSADYTAMVSAYVFGYKDKIKIYILPHPINKRMDFPKTIDAIKKLHQSQRDDNLTSKILIEEVGYQSSLSQQLGKEGITATGVKIAGQDKRARLSQTTSWIKSGRILFPKEGADILINQLIGFGVERFDDLADAFSMLVLELMKDKKGRVRVWGRNSAAYAAFHDHIIY
ncbi:phage terminase large subunit [Patescibacteria group bacterium]